jgi:hypothetical protein
MQIYGAGGRAQFKPQCHKKKKQIYGGQKGFMNKQGILVPGVKYIAISVTCAQSSSSFSLW